MAIQLLFCGVLFAGFVQGSTYHSCVVPILFFAIRFVSVKVVHSYSSTDTATAGKKFRFISSERPNIHMIDYVLLAVHLYAYVDIAFSR